MVESTWNLEKANCVFQQEGFPADTKILGFWKRQIVFFNCSGALRTRVTGPGKKNEHPAYGYESMWRLLCPFDQSLDPLEIGFRP